VVIPPLENVDTNSRYFTSDLFSSEPVRDRRTNGRAGPITRHIGTAHVKHRPGIMSLGLNVIQRMQENMIVLPGAAK